MRVRGADKMRLRQFMILSLAFLLSSLYVHTAMADSVPTVFSKWADFNKESHLLSPLVSGIGADGQRICALRNDEAVCWNRNEGSQPKFEVTRWKNPKSIQVVEGTTCVLDDDGVHCWGRFADSIEKSKPPLKHPRAMSVCIAACALDDDGAKCWNGSSVYGDTDLPALRNPRTISMGSGFACAIDDEALKCWGGHDKVDRAYGVTNVPRLLNPKIVSAGIAAVCALDDVGVHCWGDKTNVPPLKNPRSVTVGSNIACAFDDDGLKCWDSYEEVPVPQWARELKNPRLMSTGWGTVSGAYAQVCAVDDQFVHCTEVGFRKTFSDQAMPSNLFPYFLKARPEFNLDQLSLFLSESQSAMNSPRALFIQGVNKFVSSKLSMQARGSDATSARFLLVKLLSPAIQSSDSSYSQHVLVPAFIASKGRFEAELGMGEIDAVPHEALTNQAALLAMQASVGVLKEFASRQDSAPLYILNRSLGQAMADPMDKEKIQAVLSDLAAASSVTQKLSMNPKSAFLVQTMQTASNWLGKK